MTAETDPGLWKQIAQWLWMPLSGLVGVVWAMLNSRINEVKHKADSSLPREEFVRARDESREDRQNIRDDVKELFGKVDATKDLVNQRVEDARESMSRELKDLRGDMNGGFQSIRDAIERMRG